MPPQLTRVLRFAQDDNTSGEGKKGYKRNLFQRHIRDANLRILPIPLRGDAVEG